MNRTSNLKRMVCQPTYGTRSMRAAVMLAVALLVHANVGSAQLRDRQRAGESNGTRQTSASSSMMMADDLIEVPPLQGVVDPTRYVVGPSDVFYINIWTNPPLSFRLQVSPEGSLVVPTVGEFAIAGMTLAHARDSVLGRIADKYLIGNPTMSLLRPRAMVVRVEGAVRVPGNYVCYATDRVDAAIRQAGESVTPASSRHIILRRKDGTNQRVDIPLFYATREEELNPFLNEGDEIIVPRLREEDGAIGIYGGVLRPGRHEFVRGDSLTTVLQLGFGLSYRADPDSIILSRLDSTGTKMTELSFSLKDLDGNLFPNVPIQPGDRVFVRERTELRSDYRVWVMGEVQNPGRYPVTRNQTRLSEVIEMAGGITPHASLPSSRMFRTSPRPPSTQQEYLLRYRGLVAPEDSINYFAEAALKTRWELVSVDFERVVGDRDSTADIFVQTEDSIVVAAAKQTVYVFGQVRNPGHVPLQPGEDADYYIEQAGGLTEHAKGGDVMVIKRRSEQALESGETTVEDGDFVWVPLSFDRPLGYHLGIAAQAAAIVTAAATIILLIQK